MALRGSQERSDNPSSVAGLRAPVDSIGLSGTYTAASGAFITLSLDRLHLTSDTDIVFFAPVQQTGVSRYDTDLLTASLRVALPIGRLFRIEGGALRVKDRGDTLPFTADTYDARVELILPHDFALAAFAANWKYDLGGSDDQDFKVTRTGIVVRRRF